MGDIRIFIVSNSNSLGKQEKSHSASVYGYFESVQLAKTLKDKFRILAEPIGSFCHLSQQKSIKGPPFQLDHFSLAYLIKNHKEKLDFEGLDLFSLEDIINQDTYAIFETLLNKGYFLISAKKFGAKFLAYDNDPILDHAKYLVFQSDDQITDFDDISSKASDNLICINRLTTIAKKEALLARVVAFSHSQGEVGEVEHSNQRQLKRVQFSKMKRLQHY